MKLGKVTGQVWAEQKVDALVGTPLFIVQPVNSQGRSSNHPLIVADPRHLAGLYDTIVYVTSTDATQAFDQGMAPVNAAVVELVDSLD